MYREEPEPYVCPDCGSTDITVDDYEMRCHECGMRMLTKKGMQWEKSDYEYDRRREAQFARQD